MTDTIIASQITRSNFSKFGDIIDFEAANRFLINGGRCERHHALARPEAVGPEGHIVVSLFRSLPVTLPVVVAKVERHPLGSQAFIPLSPQPFLVVVCEDGPDGPAAPHAFITKPGQGINYHRNVWHGVLTPLHDQQDFVVIDRDGNGRNVEIHEFPSLISVDTPAF
jgi:ureidoglycolate lyase